MECQVISLSVPEIDLVTIKIPAPNLNNLKATSNETSFMG